MPTMIVDEVKLHIPDWVRDIHSFRRWTRQPGFPEKGNIWWLRGEVWADMSMEQIFTHLAIKGEFFRILANLVAELDGALMLPDGLLYTNEGAEISGNPDATFIAAETREAERVTLIEGKEHGFVEVIGTPDMVMEVVSDSSVKKDTEILIEAYWKAGIAEYWLVDARETPTVFNIWRHTANGYAAIRKKDKWVKSAVFGKSFRLEEVTDRFGAPKYRLEVR
jgi:Uma2 family endonuclease